MTDTLRTQHQKLDRMDIEARRRSSLPVSTLRTFEADIRALRIRPPLFQRMAKGAGFAMPFAAPLMSLAHTDLNTVSIWRTLYP
jgi:demethoxyubiquinone hydroxylase (CLK1/Coq7/Cat5 family)